MMSKTTKSILAMGGMALTAMPASAETTPVAISSANVSIDQGLRAKEFLVMGYQGIVVDLRSGNGAYLSTLMDLLHVPASQRSATIEQVKTLSQTYVNIMDFADRVLLLRQAAPANSPAIAAVVVPAGPSIYSGEKVENALNHLTRGAPVTVFLKTGQQTKGAFIEYANNRLWLRGESRTSILLRDILAVDAPSL
jgi:hypothetical protein